MFDTEVTIVGTVLSQPEGRRTNANNALVVTFRVVSNARKVDRATGAWVDKSHLRLKVTCWRKLGENVLAGVNVGDPVILRGHLSTQDWKTEEGEPRMTYELEALAVGHDLARGRGTFARMRGEQALTVEDDERPGPILGSSAGDEEDAATDMDAVAILRGAGLVPPHGGLADLNGGFAGGGPDADDEDGDPDEDESSDADVGSGGSGGRSRRRGRTPVPA